MVIRKVELGPSDLIFKRINTASSCPQWKISLGTEKIAEVTERANMIFPYYVCISDLSGKCFASRSQVVDHILNFLNE